MTQAKRTVVNGRVIHEVITPLPIQTVIGGKDRLINDQAMGSARGAIAVLPAIEAVSNEKSGGLTSNRDDPFILANADRFVNFSSLKGLSDTAYNKFGAK